MLLKNILQRTAHDHGKPAGSSFNVAMLAETVRNQGGKREISPPQKKIQKHV